MKGCLKRAGCLLAILLVLCVLWYWYVQAGRPKLTVTTTSSSTATTAPSVASGWQPLTAADAVRGRVAVQSLGQRSGPVFASMTPAEAASYIFTVVAKQLPPTAKNVEASVVGDRLYVRAVGGVTATVGARYGKFTSKGNEDTPLVGPLSIDSSKSEGTSAVNLVFHVTPQINLIANAMRGFRAPNLDDMSVYRVTASTGIDIPSAGLDPENVKSYELGAKYENARVSGSAFFFQNSFTNLITRGLGYYNGLPFVDTNKNGVQDKGELSLHQNSNIGSEKISGYELELRTHLTTTLQLFGNYARLKSDVNTDPTLYTKILPKSGVLGARYTPNMAFSPWGELVMRYASRVASGLPVDGYHVFTIRTGASVTPKFSVSAALENITNERYAFLGTSTSPSLFAPGRQLVIGTQFRF